MVSRGQVYFVDLNPTHGREQAGRRPVLVVSSNAINQQPLVVTVVVGPDARNVPRDYPINIRVSAKESGIRSLDPGRFVDPKTGQPTLAGALPPTRMADVERALRLVPNL